MITFERTTNDAMVWLSPCTKFFLFIYQTCKITNPKNIQMFYTPQQYLRNKSDGYIIFIFIFDSRDRRCSARCERLTIIIKP